MRIMFVLYENNPCKYEKVFIHFSGDEYDKMELNLRAYQLLNSMMNMCQMRRPGVSILHCKRERIY